jgi:hypothetical protein
MAILLIKCPHTGRPISTGIEVYSAETLAKLPDVLSHIKCPECGLEHAWWTREAWLQDRVEVPPAEGGLNGVSPGDRAKTVPAHANRNFAP